LGNGILSYLKGGSWVSGEDMANRRGISRAAVWKQIQLLRAKGYDIESSTNKGYRLVSEPDLLDAGALRQDLKTKIVGRDIYYYPEVESTNNTARKLAWSCDDGTVVVAETQRAGKGRRSRSWHSPPGGLWISVILKPRISLDQAYRINMAASVAVARTLSSLYGIKATIKWPNDILVNDKKICGILLEISAEVDRLDYAIIGIGLNANVEAKNFPKDWKVISLSEELGSRVSRTDLAQRLLEELENAYRSMGSKEGYEDWCRLSATLGKQVRITSYGGDLEGLAESLSEDGALMLRLPGETRRILAGDCIHLNLSDQHPDQNQSSNQI
jgi:BirA family transcriptional regulator, biotin operon repressor / biotin---[acetyl-CoA-carboxylase] ligase